MRTWIRTLRVVTVALLGACVGAGEGDGTAELGERCARNDDCADGLGCDGATCRTSCTTSAACQASERCDGRLCVAGAGECARTEDCVGQEPNPCQVASDCYEGACEFNQQPVGEACSTVQVVAGYCNAGECVRGCFIDGQVIPDGGLRTNLSFGGCQECAAATAPLAWTVLADLTTCQTTMAASCSPTGPVAGTTPGAQVTGFCDEGLCLAADQQGCTNTATPAAHVCAGERDPANGCRRCALVCGSPPLTLSGSAACNESCCRTAEAYDCDGATPDGTCNASGTCVASPSACLPPC